MFELKVESLLMFTSDSWGWKPKSRRISINKLRPRPNQQNQQNLGGELIWKLQIYAD